MAGIWILFFGPYGPETWIEMGRVALGFGGGGGMVAVTGADGLPGTLGRPGWAGTFWWAEAWRRC